MVAESVADPEANPQETDGIREPATGRFLPGNNANPLGRPRKGQTIAERVKVADDKVAKKAIKARDKRLQLTNMVGERAWSTYLAYNLGLPKQTFVMEQGEDKVAGFLASVIQGDYRVLPPGEPDPVS